MHASVAGTDNYDGIAEVTVDFVVTKAANAWTTVPSIAGWEEDKYEEDKNAPAGSAKYGEIDRKYYAVDASGNITGEALTSLPTKVGNYMMVLHVEGTQNYSGLDAQVAFTVTAAAQSNTGLIIGIVVCAVLAVCLAGGLVFLLLKKKEAPINRIALS